MRTVATLLVILIASTIAVAQAPIRVGAWNLERLGTPSARDYPKKRKEAGYKVPRQPTDVAAQIRKLNVDVLALTEVDDDDQEDPRRNNSILDKAIAELNADGAAWKCRLFGGRQRGSSTYLTGVMWNEKRINIVGRPLRIPVRDITRKYSEWARAPYAIQFSRGDRRTDFVVVPIHMKAGDKKASFDQRREEARSLIAEIDYVREHFEDEDLILIGDFNFRSKDGGAFRDEPAGRALRDAGFFDLNYGDVGTHVTGWALDRCYIPRSQRESEFKSVRRLQIMAPADQVAFKRKLSDHWPIVLEFPEQGDDDPIQ